MTPSKDGSRLFWILNRAWRSTSTIFEHEPIGLWPVPDTKNLIVWHIGSCVDVVTPGEGLSFIISGVRPGISVLGFKVESPSGAPGP